jgi:hypothetical protein
MGLAFTDLEDPALKRWAIFRGTTGATAPVAF